MTTPEQTASTSLCLNCGEHITWPEWFSGDCPKPDNLRGAGHRTQQSQGPPIVCSKCKITWPDDRQVAASKPCKFCEQHLIGQEETR